MALTNRSMSDIGFITSYRSRTMFSRVVPSRIGGSFLGTSGEQGIHLSLLVSCGFSLLLVFSVLSSAAFSQENLTSAQTQNESTIEGTAASVSRQTFVVRTEDKQFYLFTFNCYTDKPQSILVGTTVAQSPKLPIPENRKYPPASNRLKVISSQKK
jgi:hypothetical protein